MSRKKNSTTKLATKLRRNARAKRPVARWHKRVPPEYAAIDPVLKDHIHEFIEVRLPLLDRYHTVTTVPPVHPRYTIISVTTSVHQNQRVSFHVDEPSYFINGNIRVTVIVMHENVPAHRRAHVMIGANVSTNKTKVDKASDFNCIIDSPAFFDELDVFLDHSFQFFLREINVQPPQE